METPELKPRLRILVLGGSGMLGHDLVLECERRGWEVRSPVRADFDLKYQPNLERLRRKDFGDFDWILNCAAYTQVDQAESETMAAITLNAVVPGSLAAVCRENGWRMMHLSTDFVFDGSASVPYHEDSATNPLGTYGRSKLMGERNVLEQAASSLVVRTAWLFGSRGKCFPRTMVEAFLAEKSLRVVADQTGSPTYTHELARVLADLVTLAPSGGVYHAVGPDTLTWHQFAVQVLETYCSVKSLARDVVVEAVTTSDWPTPARRPAYSVLSTDKILGLGIAPMRPLAETLPEYCRQLG